MLLITSDPFINCFRECPQKSFISLKSLTIAPISNDDEDCLIDDPTTDDYSSHNDK